MAGATNWQVPIIKEHQRVAFPIQSVPHYLADLSKAIAETVQVPVELPYFAALAVIATATNGKVQVNVANRYTESLSLYSVVFLGSANRKSQVIKILKAPLLELEADLVKAESGTRAQQLAEQRTYERNLESVQNRAGKAGVTDELLADLAAATEKLEQCKVKELPRILCDNVTPEKHAELIAIHGSIGHIEPEGDFFNGLARYSGDKAPQVTYLNKAHGGEPFRFDRRNGSSFYAEQPHAVIHVSTQRRDIANVRSNEVFTGTGFMNRFLFSAPQSLIGERFSQSPPLAAGQSESWSLLVTGLFKNCYNREPKVLTLEGQAYAMLLDFNEKLEPQLITTLLPIQGWAGKLAGACVSIAGLYELAANPHAATISTASLETALALAPYLIDQAIEVLTTPLEDKPARKILTYLIREAEKLQAEQSSNVGNVGALLSYTFTTRSVQSQFGKSAWLVASDKPAMTLRGLLIELQESYWIQQLPAESTDKGGRPKELWELNPQAALYINAGNV